MRSLSSNASSITKVSTTNSPSYSTCLGIYIDNVMSTDISVRRTSAGKIAIPKLNISTEVSGITEDRPNKVLTIVNLILLEIITKTNMGKNDSATKISIIVNKLILP